MNCPRNDGMINPRAALRRISEQYATVLRPTVRRSTVLDASLAEAPRARYVRCCLSHAEQLLDPVSATDFEDPGKSYVTRKTQEPCGCHRSGDAAGTGDHVF